MDTFVTGATGAIGLPAVRALVAGGHRVTAVARTPEKEARLRDLGATPVAVDLFDPAAVEDAVAGHQVVVNLATRIPSSTRALRARNWAENDRIRRQVSRNLAGAVVAQGPGRLVQESIAFAYADGGDRWLTEDEPLATSPITDALEVAEEAAQSVTAAGGTGVVARFANFYGPGASHTRDWLRMVRRRIAPTLGDPAGHWPVIHLDDAATAVVAALALPAGTYHVADDEPLTKAELGATIAAALDVAPPRQPPGLLTGLLARRLPTLAGSYRVSNRALRAASDWAPRYPTARDGIPPTVAALTGP